MAEKAILAIADSRKRDLSRVEIKKYTLQFNPSELSIGAGEPLEKRTDNRMYKSGTGRKRKLAEYPAEQFNIKVNLPIVFDSTEDSVADSRGRVNKAYGVRSEVEGFIAMVRNPNIGYFTFSWGALCYTGELVSVSGQYTMFSESGMPLRAQVNLTMKCVDIDNGSQWIDMYRAAFGGGVKLSGGLGKMSAGKLEKAILKIAVAKYNSVTKKLNAVKDSFYNLQVFYNPASISLSSGISTGGDMSEIGEDKKSRAGVELSFQLIFDSPEEESGDRVAVLCNGLVSLMTDRSLTKVEFAWGSMAFSGKLTSIQNKFIRFSKEGFPLMAKMSLSVAEDNREDSYWEESFKNMREKKYGVL